MLSGEDGEVVAGVHRNHDISMSRLRGTARVPFRGAIEIVPTRSIAAPAVEPPGSSPPKPRRPAYFGQNVAGNRVRAERYHLILSRRGFPRDTTILGAQQALLASEAFNEQVRCNRWTTWDQAQQRCVRGASDACPRELEENLGGGPPLGSWEHHGRLKSVQES